MGFSIVLVPFWSAFTDAFTRGEIGWIRSSMTKLLRMLGVVVAALIVMFAVAPWVFKLWLGDRVAVSWQLNLLMVVYVFIRSWNNIFAYFINGVGKIKLQLVTAVVVSVINIPLSIFLGRDMGMGINGVIAATIICLLLGTFLHPIQYYKIVTGKAKGIWNQ